MLEVTLSTVTRPFIPSDNIATIVAKLSSPEVSVMPVLTPPLVDGDYYIMYTIDNGPSIKLGDSIEIPKGDHDIVFTFWPNRPGKIGLDIKFLQPSLVEVVSWTGDNIEYIRLGESINLVKVPDTLPPSVTSTINMFSHCRIFNQDISNWDVSRVTDFSGMFTGCEAFDHPIGKWDMRNATTISGMFSYTKNFKHSIEQWDLSNVTDASNLFYHSDYNQPLNDLDVSNITRMNSMFDGNKVFNQPLDKWDVRKVDTMQNMFSRTAAFDQPLEGWDVSNVSDFSVMFYDATAFNQPLNNWNTSNNTELAYTFAKTTAFNQPLDKWDVSKVNSFLVTFMQATAFDQDLTGWVKKDTADITQMDDGATAWEDKNKPSWLKTPA